MSNLRLDILLTTKEGRKLMRHDDRAGGPPNNREHYYSEDGCAELVCSTDEREDYERTELNPSGKPTIDADTLGAEQFSEFCGWLKKNAGLKLEEVGTQG